MSTLVKKILPIFITMLKEAKEMEYQFEQKYVMSMTSSESDSSISMFLLIGMEFIDWWNRSKTLDNKIPAAIKYKCIGENLVYGYSLTSKRTFCKV